MKPSGTRTFVQSVFVMLMVFCGQTGFAQPDFIDQEQVQRHIATLENDFWESAWYSYRVSMTREDLPEGIAHRIPFERRPLRGHQRELLTRWDFATRQDSKDYTDQLIRELRESNFFLVDPSVSDYLYRTLYAVHPNRFLPGRPGNLSIHVSISPFPDAYAFGDGTIIVTSALLSLLRTEDELASVLAHEVAHVILDHSVVNIVDQGRRRQRAETLGAIFGTLGALAVLSLGAIGDLEPSTTARSAYDLALALDKAVRDASESQGLKYQRQQESDADFLAQSWLRYSGRDTLAFGRALVRLRQDMRERGETERAGTHPLFSDRIRDLHLLTPELRDIDIYDTAYDTHIAPVLLTSALLETENRNYRQSLVYIERIINSDWPIPDAYVLKARALRHLHDTEQSNLEALDALRIAEELELDPNPVFDYERAMLLLRMERYDEAEESLLRLRDHLSPEPQIESGTRRWINDMLIRIRAMRQRQ